MQVISPLAGGNQSLFFWMLNEGGYVGQYACNLLLYTNITFDIQVQKGTPPDANGDFGVINVGFLEGGWTWDQISSLTIPGAASNGWVHMVCPVNPQQANIDNCQGICFSITSWGGYPQFTFTNWIGNLAVNQNPGPPPPPPTMSTKIPPAITGFNATATDPNGPNDREHILTAVATGYSFVGQSSVTYAWTNKAWPNIATANNWQEDFFIVSGTSSSGAPNGDPGQYDTATDWNMANVLWFTVQQDTNGTGYINFRCKTNEPAGNGMIFNTLTLDNVTNVNQWPVEPLCMFRASTPLGPWSVNITSGGLITITTPDQTSTNFQMDAATTALFADPCTLCLGIQPNNANGYGQTTVISGFGVQGNATPFSEDFTSETAFSSNWRVLASDPNGVILVPPGSACWVSWNLPDQGFSFQSSPNLTGAWNNPTVLTRLNNNLRQVLVPSSAVGANQGYFRLIKRVFSQLQVLLPGEVAAPNTLTGKTGTPLAQSSGVPFNVIINACDATWNVVNVTDDCVLTDATDSGFIVLDGTDASQTGMLLVNGTGTLSVEFLDDSSSQITATDITNILIPAANSATVTY
jgi:hypothetical protein